MALDTGLYCNQRQFYWQLKYWYMGLCIRQDNMNVYASVDLNVPTGLDKGYVCLVSLNRWNPTKKEWEIVETKRTDSLSDGATWNVQFSNIAVMGRKIDVKAHFESGHETYSPQLNR